MSVASLVGGVLGYLLACVHRLPILRSVDEMVDAAMIKKILVGVSGLAVVTVLIAAEYEDYVTTGHADPGISEVIDNQRVLLNDADECLKRSFSNMSKDELAHCDHVFTQLGNGDPYQGMITAIAEFTSRP